ncbi:unnamed protein product [Anisakis simplex]|uniref:LXG domain-containing protein n=1 Tax=Anisakis simplex TaxID=6269 RepID=A0A0M3IYQ7_ANISI|nr:unnamed protein product [Anisakis simplex]
MSALTKEIVEENPRAQLTMINEFRQLSDAYGKIGPRSRNFSGDVMQVHTLVNEMDSTLSSTLKATKEGVLFPVYRTQGYDS